MVRALAQLGEHGWELVTVYDKSSNWFASMEKGFMLFKRPVPEGEEPDGKWASVWMGPGLPEVAPEDDDPQFTSEVVW